MESRFIKQHRRYKRKDSGGQWSGVDKVGDRAKPDQHAGKQPRIVRAPGQSNLPSASGGAPGGSSGPNPKNVDKGLRNPWYRRQDGGTTSGQTKAKVARQRRARARADGQWGAIKAGARRAVGR